MQDGYSAFPVRATAHLMPFDSYHPGSYLLTSIEVGHEARGQGVGSRLLKRVLDDADKEGVVLYLDIQPDGTGLDERQLRAWYERRGFRHAPNLEDTALVREPRGGSG